MKKSLRLFALSALCCLAFAAACSSPTRVPDNQPIPQPITPPN